MSHSSSGTRLARILPPHGARWNEGSQIPQPQPQRALRPPKLGLLLPSFTLLSSCSPSPRPSPSLGGGGGGEWGGAGLGSARPVHSREHGQLEQQRSPVVGRESSGGCGALARRWLLGRGLAWGRSRGPTPAPPGRCLASSEELGVGFNGGRGNGAGDRSLRGLPGLKTTPLARRGSPESVHPGPGLRCPTWGPGSKVCKVGRRRARTRAAPGENWPQTHGAHRSPK